MKVSNVSAQEEKRIRNSILPSALTVGRLDALGYRSFAEVVEDEEHALVTRNIQRVMHCPCGNHKVLALGLCATCYTLKRQDEEYFGGLREAVLERDGYRCRVCDASVGYKRSIIVHHRVPESQS